MGQQVTTLTGHQGGVTAVCPVTIGGRNLLVCGGFDETVRIWEPTTGKPVRTLEGHQDSVRSVCSLTIDGHALLASGSDDRTVRIWDHAVGVSLLTIPIRYRALAVSEAGTLLEIGLGAGVLVVKLNTVIPLRTYQA